MADDYSVVPPNELLTEDEQQRQAFWNSIQPTYTPSVTPNQLAPHIKRGPDGQLTLDGQPPTTMLPNGIPAWESLTPTDKAIIYYESGGRNILQQQVDPSISSAGGYYQITDSTWKDIAPKAGIDVHQYPTAISAPFEVQTAAAHALQQERGLSPWVPYNPQLRNALGAPALKPGLMGPSQAGLPASLSQPVVAAASPPQTINVNMPSSSGPEEAGMKTNPLVMLSILQKMMAGTHSFTPVDYDPWKVANLGKEIG
jgi:hypothetical protein